MIFSPFWFIIRRPKLIMIFLGFLMFGIGLNGVIEGISNRAPKTETISQFETEMPTSGWYHITGAELDTAHAVALDKYGERASYGDPTSTIIAPLVGPNDINGATGRILLRTSDPTLVADAGPGGALPPVDVTGMIDVRTSNGQSNTIGADTDGAIIFDEGRKPAAIFPALGELICGTILIIFGFAMYLGLQVPFLDGQGYEWSAENYKEKPSAKSPQANRGPAYPPQSNYPSPPNYGGGAVYFNHGQHGQPQPSIDDSQPKMRTLE